MYQKGEPVDGQVAVVDLLQAQEADYNLSPSRWIASQCEGREHDLGDLVEELKTISNDLAVLDQQVLRLLRPLAGGHS